MSIKRWKLGWKRCDCVKCEAALTIEQTEEDCGWVMWEDHKEEVTRLKAEVERLTQNTDKLCKHGDLEIERLKAEVERLHSQFANSERQVERLRKAGDALDLSVGADWAINGPDDGTEPESVKAWNAAKEGKPSV